MADWEIPVYWICSPSLSTISSSGKTSLYFLRALLTWLEFLDSKLARLAMSADSFVHSSVGSAADEADDLVSVL